MIIMDKKEGVTMKQHHFTVKSHMDGLPLSVLLVEPDIAPKAIVQILHGMCENKERYEHFMRYLARQGFVSVIHDHRGHGGSVYSKDDLGYLYANGAKYLVEDCNQISRMARKRYKELPIYLLGHSMGSLVARAYIKRYDRVIDGLILTGSPSYNPALKFVYPLTKIAGKIFGDRTEGHFVQKLVLGSYNRKLDKPASENSWICSDEDVVKNYDESDLCGFIFTLNGFEHLFKLMITVYDKHHWHMNNKRLPIWFASGSEDPCMNTQGDFIKAVNLMKDVGYKNVKYTLYKGMRHEILNEKDRKKVYHDIVTKIEVWLNQGNYGAVRRK